MDLEERTTTKKTHIVRSFTATNSGTKGQFIEIDIEFENTWMTKAQAKTLIASLEFHIKRIDKYDKSKRKVVPNDN